MSLNLLLELFNYKTGELSFVWAWLCYDYFKIFAPMMVIFNKTMKIQIKLILMFMLRDLLNVLSNIKKIKSNNCQSWHREGDLISTTKQCSQFLHDYKRSKSIRNTTILLSSIQLLWLKLFIGKILDCLEHSFLVLNNWYYSE